MTTVSEAEQTFFILRTGQLSRFTSKWNESWPGPWSCKTGPFSEWAVSKGVSTTWPFYASCPDPDKYISAKR